MVISSSIESANADEAILATDSVNSAFVIEALRTNFLY